MRATAGTALTSLGLQGVLVVSGVVAARLLGVTARGQLALFWIVALIIAQLGTLGVPAAITYYIAGGRIRGRQVLKITRSLLLLQCVILVCVQAGILWLLERKAHAPIRDAASVTLLAMPALMLHQYGLAVLQGRHRFRLYNLQQAIPVLLYGLGLLVVAATNNGTLIIVTATWVASIVAGGIATFVVASRTADGPLSIAQSDSPLTVRDLVRFGVRAIFGVFTGFEQLQLDQAIVGLVLSTRALGLYVVAIAFSNLPRFIGQSIGLVAYPAVARVQGTTEVGRALWRFFALGVVVCSAVVIGLIAIIPTVLPAFFGQSFRSAVSVAEILLVGALFQSVRRVLSDAGRGAGYPLLGTVAELTSWMLVIPAVAVLATDGLQGVAIVFMIGSIASFVVVTLGLLLLRRRDRFGLVARSETSRPPSNEPSDSLVPEVTWQ